LRRGTAPEVPGLPAAPPRQGQRSQRKDIGMDAAAVRICGMAGRGP